MPPRKSQTIDCCFLALVLAPLMTQPALGMEKQASQTIDEMVVTATKSEEKISEIPAKIEVVDRHEIEMTAGSTLTEQLKKSSSLAVIEYPGALAGIGIRGFRPEFSGITKHSLILLDGRPVGATNLATVLTDNVERIEVLKGPASSLYGAEAMGGVVNVITKKNTKELSGDIEAGFGSFATNFQKAAIGGAIVKDKLDFDVTAGRFEQDGDFKMGDNGDKRANTSYNTRNGAFRLGGNFATDWRVDLSTNVYKGRDIATPGDVAYGNVQNGSKDIDNLGTDVRIGGGLGANNKVGATAYFTREEAENYSNYSGSKSVPTYRSYDSETTWKGTQLQDTYSWGDHTLIAGIDYQYIEKISRSYTTGSSRKAPSSPDEGRTNIAGYFESVWKFSDDRLTLTGGGRYDDFEVETLSTPYKTDFNPNSENFSTFSPRVGANYLFDLGIRLHATAGRAFVPPSALQLAGYSESVVDGVTMTTKGNADLDPETSATWDVGTGYALRGWGLALDCTYFHTTVNDRITTEQSGNVKTSINSLDSEIQGIESSISFDLGVPLDLGRSLKVYFNSTNILKAEEEVAPGTMRDIYNVADYTYNYGIEYDDKKVDGKLHFRNVGPMRDTDWVTAGYPEVEYPSFTVIDLVVGYNFLDHHRLALTIDNFLDEDYYEKKGYPKPGQSFLISYTYHF